MIYGFSFWLIILGVLGAANLIISRKPEAKEIIDKLVPYQGWFGFASFVWGIFTILRALSWMSAFGMGFGITVLAIGIILMLLGAILGVGVAKTFIKNKDAQKKMMKVVDKLIPFQGTLGFIAIFLGIWGIISSFILM
jgi:hypothetical protein